MKAEHVNPFIISVCKIMKDMCMVDLKIGTPSVRNKDFSSDSSLIRLGLVGQLQGEVILNIERDAALGVVSKMMMMPVESIDEIGQSAISELGNMVAGNAATVFANNNILIDITPPSYCLGENYTDNTEQLFSVPFTSDIGRLSVDIYIKE